MHYAIVAAGAVLHYLKETEHPNLQHVTNIQRIERKIFCGWIVLPSEILNCWARVRTVATRY
jgi:hypothetical protein